jgi:3',5'-cyclic AMP phosphodiesterase CpdA
MKTPQLQIVHLSDLHFGEKHRFDPPRTPTGDRPSRTGHPTLVEKLSEDLVKDPGCPAVICITGDFATTASYDEFACATEFIRQLKELTIGGARVAAVFVVPGNHDVEYDSPHVAERWGNWTHFGNGVLGTNVRPDAPWQFVQIHDRIDDLGAVFVCLNSSIYVEKNKPDQDRGHIDARQLAMVRAALEKIPQTKLESSIRIALIHHHPVLIPALAEEKRGYDAVVNSGMLLQLLREFGFHMVLHGHKHHPHVFADDSQSAFTTQWARPILVVAGGSVGSRELPAGPHSQNCYNRIAVKWHAAAAQMRAVVETRGLQVFDKLGREMLPTSWQWHALRDDDRHFLGGPRAPAHRPGVHLPFDQVDGRVDIEDVRSGEYRRTRGNLPVVEVLPSLLPGQAYEARVWIVGHWQKRELPQSVLWSAGPKFPAKKVSAEEDELFRASFHYWGSMLVQGQLSFADGSIEYVHVYARVPGV